MKDEKNVLKTEAHADAIADNSAVISRAEVGVLLVDDDVHLLKRYQGLLMRRLLPQYPNLFVETAWSVEEALSKDSSKIGVIVLDQYFENLEKSESKFPNGIDAIAHIKSILDVPILVHTSSGEIADAVRAIKFGAVNYVFKGDEGSPDLLCNAVNQVLLDRKHKIENEILLRGGQLSNETKAPFVIKSKSMKRALENIDRIAKSDYPILLLGETGVGKSHIANEIHKMRGGFGPFLEYNVGEANMQVVEAELFGSVRGAFTGAVNKEGLFRLANGGTLFLDEIGEASIELQNKILTAVETKRFSKVGAPGQKITSNFRLITATNKNPQTLIEEKKMKHDFYARIRGYEITIPPLRERREEIPDLIRALVPKVSSMMHIPLSYRQLPADFIEWLTKNLPPFNVRGLENVLKDLLTFAPIDEESGRPVLRNWQQCSPFRGHLRSQDLSASTLTWRDLLSSETVLLTDDFPGFKEFTLRLQEKIVKESSGKYKKAGELSKSSGISVATLYRRGLSRGMLRKS